MLSDFSKKKILIIAGSIFLVMTTATGSYFAFRSSPGKQDAFPGTPECNKQPQPQNGSGSAIRKPILNKNKQTSHNNNQNKPLGHQNENETVVEKPITARDKNNSAPSAASTRSKLKQLSDDNGEGEIASENGDSSESDTNTAKSQESDSDSSDDAESFGSTFSSEDEEDDDEEEDDDDYDDEADEKKKEKMKEKEKEQEEGDEEAEVDDDITLEDLDSESEDEDVVEEIVGKVKVNDTVSINVADNNMDSTLQDDTKPVKENALIIPTNGNLSSVNRAVSYDQISEAESGSDSD